ncbi:MAG TPA: AI-2E family transporter [Eubacteriaceae bacterium]|nr:AI-2E family transporter [Eubacteriaceae bacterium]
MRKRNKYFQITLPILITLLIIFLLGQMDYLISPVGTILTIVITPMIFAALFYYMLRPVIRFLTKRNVPKTLSVAGVFIIGIGLLVLFVIYGGSFMQKELSSFYDNISGQFQRMISVAQEYISEDEIWIFSIEELQGRLASAAQIGFEQIGENLSGWVSTITNFGTILVLIPIVSFFLLKDDEVFYQNLMKVLPKKHKETTKELAKEIDNTLSVYITGQMIVAFFLGIVTYIGYLIIGLPNALILAIFSMITSIIPFIGPAIGVLPAILIGFTVDLFMVVKVFIVLAVSQQLEGNLIRPNVMGSRLRIHPLVIIFIILIAILLYGFIGAFIAIPVYAVIRVLVKHFWEKRREREEEETSLPKE